MVKGNFKRKSSIWWMSRIAFIFLKDCSAALDTQYIFFTAAIFLILQCQPRSVNQNLFLVVVTQWEVFPLYQLHLQFVCRQIHLSVRSCMDVCFTSRLCLETSAKAPVKKKKKCIWYAVCFIGSLCCVPLCPGWSFSMGSAYQFHSWRVFVVVCALPCVCAVVALTFMPESPRFYLEVMLFCPSGKTK